jgi:hypothetical protein
LLACVLCFLLKKSKLLSHSTHPYPATSANHKYDLEKKTRCPFRSFGRQRRLFPHCLAAGREAADRLPWAAQDPPQTRRRPEPVRLYGLDPPALSLPGLSARSKSGVFWVRGIWILGVRGVPGPPRKLRSW